MTHDSLSAGADDGVIRYAYLANEIVFDRRFDAPLEKLWDFVPVAKIGARVMAGASLAAGAIYPIALCKRTSL